ncbi:MAG: c-type cytochrome [Gammaproteobacteria bacterium]|nr:c-type cytochrome [Gammaproteobacteria bacterium]
MHYLDLGCKSQSSTRWHLVVKCLFTVLAATTFLTISEIGLAQGVNPLDSNPRAAAAGGSLFRAQCATCHGADAKGIPSIQAPDLTQLWSQTGNTDETVFQTIRNGIPGSIMPPHSFTDTEIWMLVSYLKSTGGGNSSDSYDGNPSRGEWLFASNCSSCHRVNGAGGSLGPDLSRITARRSKQALAASIRDPSGAVGRGYRPVTLITGDNKRIDGAVKSEDAFSIQVMDQRQVLRGFRKAELMDLQRNERSLMPVFNERTLSDAELEDVLAFLANLAGQSGSRAN